MRLSAHPAAAVFPLGPPAELEELADDIREHGLHHAIVVHDGRIVDGRRRQRACELAGVEPRLEEWNGRGGSIVDFIVSENLQRRHLTTSQRALVAVELLPFYEAEAKEDQRAAGREHGRGKPAPHVAQAIRGPMARDRAAKAVGLGGETVRRAAKVVEQAPDLAAEIRDGTRSVRSAAMATGIIGTGTPAPRGPARARYFGKGDKFDEVTQPLARYLAAWRKRDYAFRHLSPDQAKRRLAVVDRLVAELEAARRDLEPRSKRATLNARDRR